MFSVPTVTAAVPRAMLLKRAPNVKVPDASFAHSNVRMHHRLASFLYGGALNRDLTEDYQEFSGVFTGEQRGMSHNIFRKGTAFIQIVVMIEGNGTLEFKNIKFEEIQ